jgi:pyruvate/2-oxoglutarate dehydrogenase complex dihydrolipoamide acyltransferase (E2) component
MKQDFFFRRIPQSRIATFDVFAIGLKKHHVTALIECDVTALRENIRQLKRQGTQISFTARMIHLICTTLYQHPEVAAYKVNKRKLISFENINVSVAVEKSTGNDKVPMPMVILNAEKKSASQIFVEIEHARSISLSNKDIVLNKKPRFYEGLYYRFPGFLRRLTWHVMLKRYKFVHKSMGNVMITSLSGMGKVNGWFVYTSIHPVSFGLGAIIKKPVVINDEIHIREMMNMTILLDHDVIDGAPMARFVKHLVRNIESWEVYTKTE